MDKSFPIPVALVGPGSQPESEEQLKIMQMPSGMSTFHQPILPEPEEVAELESAKKVLQAAVDALRAYRPGEPSISVSLEGLEPANLELISQAMGEGEVSIIAEGLSPVHIQESVFAGLWRVQHMDADGKVVRDSLEAADIPGIVRSLTFADATGAIDTGPAPAEMAAEVLNAPSLLVEIDDQMASWKPGDTAHVINLTLLPLSDADLTLLGSRLGVGPVTLLSRGYGNCRIGSTTKQNVWWLKYYNTDDALILNIIEVSEIPEVAMAAPEDLADSANRLAAIVEFYQ